MVMIIAEIGRTHYKLANIQDAEALLRILSRAQGVEESFELAYDENRWYEQPHASPIQVAIVEGKLLTYDEAQAAIAAARAEKMQKAEAKD